MSWTQTSQWKGFALLGAGGPIRGECSPDLPFSVETCVSNFCNFVSDRISRNFKNYKHDSRDRHNLQQAHWAAPLSELQKVHPSFTLLQTFHSYITFNYLTMKVGRMWSGLLNDIRSLTHKDVTQVETEQGALQPILESQSTHQDSEELNVCTPTTFFWQPHLPALRWVLELPWRIPSVAIDHYQDEVLLYLQL